MGKSVKNLKQAINNAIKKNKQNNKTKDLNKTGDKK